MMNERKMNDYKVQIEIHPEKKWVRSVGRIRTYHTEQRIHRYYIVDEMDVRISSEHLLRVDIQETDQCFFRKAMKEITIFFQHTLDPYIDFIFEAEGTLEFSKMTVGNIIDDDYTEICVYTPIIPIDKELEPMNIDCLLICSHDYECIHPNRDVVERGYRFYGEAFDVAFVLVKKEAHHYLEKENVRVSWFQEKMNNEPEEIINQTNTILNFYKSWFKEAYFKRLEIVFSPRKEGGGYCRNGYIVLTDDQIDTQRMIRYIAHEVAHLWWNKASTMDGYEDWLNESFAEWSALKVYEEIFGKEEYRKIVDRYRARIDNLPAITDITRGHVKAMDVFYIKGPIILIDFEKEIGGDPFIHLLKLVHEKGIRKTEDLYTLIDEHVGQDAKNMLERLLNQ